MPPATSGLENNPPDDIVNHIESNESTHSNVRSVPSSPLSNQSQRFYTIEEVQEIINNMQKLKIEPEKSQRLPSASLFADVAQPPVAISRVPYAEHVTTTTAQSKVLESIRFSNSGSTNKDQLKQFKLSLIETRLLPLAKGNRLQPICSTANTFGYTDDTIVNTDGKSILIPNGVMIMISCVLYSTSPSSPTSTTFSLIVWSSDKVQYGISSLWNISTALPTPTFARLVRYLTILSSAPANPSRRILHRLKTPSRTSILLAIPSCPKPTSYIGSKRSSTTTGASLSKASWPLPNQRT